MVGFIYRFKSLIKSFSYDYVYIFRETTPIGPPIYEFILSCIFRKKIIYDFDDAIWLPFKSSKNNLTNRLKFTSKVNHICKWSYKISCGNAYLADYARQFNKNVRVIPTIVDTDMIHNKVKLHSNNCLTVGWTGSHSTLKYLDLLVEVVDKLQGEIEFDFIVIADQNPKLPLKKFRFIQWSENREVEDLLQFDIGLMPLPDDEWAKGKCGFKAIQYLSLGIPALVSPVGVNSKIVSHDVNGYHCESPSEWENYLRILLNSEAIRSRLGNAGRKRIVQAFSKKSTKEEFISLFS